MRKAGITDFEAFARDVLEAIPDRPISFEVFSDDFAEMERQARLIAAWGPNVYVKIPVTNTKGASAAPRRRARLADGIQLNVTALLTVDQVRVVRRPWPAAPRRAFRFLRAASPTPASIRCRSCANRSRSWRRTTQLELIWASPRELLNIVQADAAGAHIITVTNDLLAKLPTLGKDLAQFSLETVQMFIATPPPPGSTSSSCRCPRSAGRASY